MSLITRLLELKDKRILELETLLQEGVEIWLENHKECTWSKQARILLNYKGKNE